MIKNLRKELPQGAINKIAQKTGLCTKTVSYVIKGYITSPQAAKIFKATAEYLAEYKANEKEAIEAINQILSKEPETN